MKPLPSPPPAPPHLALEAFLPYRLSVLSERVSGAIARLYAERFALTIPEWRVMAVLGRFGPTTASGLCERTQMDKVRVSRAVSRLIGARRVARAVDPRDRRRADLALTPAGRMVFDLIVPLALGAEDWLLEPLDADERAALGRLLGKLEARAATPLAVSERPRPDPGSDS